MAADGADTPAVNLTQGSTFFRRFLRICKLDCTACVACCICNGDHMRSCTSSPKMQYISKIDGKFITPTVLETGELVHVETLLLMAVWGL